MAAYDFQTQTQQHRAIHAPGVVNLRHDRDEGAPHVLVVATTYRRLDEIASLAPQLLCHAEECTRSLGCPTDVLVVDNDPHASARATIATIAGVDYVWEPVPGIAAARNRALDEAAHHDLVVFIDDDERPTPDWLCALVRTWLTDQPAAVSGHVLSLLDEDVDPWILEGDLFHRPNPPTGTELPALGAGNLLLDLHQVRSWQLRFDPRYGLTGGEDTLFTRQIRRHGGRLVWCRESVTVDRVPADRLTRRWLAKRFFRQGNSQARIDLELTRPRRRPLVRSRLMMQGALRVLGGSGQWLVGVAARKLNHQARGLRVLMRGLGLIFGALGVVHQEYARTESEGDE